MITIDGKVYRTLPEQVEENAKNIAGFDNTIEDINNRVDIVEDKVDAAITVEQVRAIVDEELGVIVNGRY